MSSENTASYEKIHYLLRPAKNVQRKMLCEAFRRLGKARELSEYRYIGFGSMYYGDFILFHKALGIERMASIEYEKGEKRARFNRPYECVTVLPGRAAAKLIELNWKECPAIVWLDYDYGLEKEVLSDIAQVAANVISNSMLIVTVDASEKGLAKLRDEDDVEYDFDLEEFESEERQIGKLNLKCGTKFPVNTDLRDGGIAKIYRKLINARIADAVNSLRINSQKLKYHQVFNFRYSDGRDMMTVGGIVSPINLNIKRFGFKALRFCRPNTKSFDIEAPKLTLREIREMNRALPCSDAGKIRIPIPKGDKMLYQQIYRYFPTFTEAEL